MKKWKPSKVAAREFAETMNEIEKYCATHNIKSSASSDSYYFTVNGIPYRVSNHSVEASNAHSANFLGEKVREKYHEDGRNAGTIYIHASKARIIEIHKAILGGSQINGRGQIVS